MIYLGVKTHRNTGKKYLFKTGKKNPYSYPGSGKYWKAHLRKHGDNCDTDILLATNSKREIRETGLFFSKLWNIVESDNWANLIPEGGDGASVGSKWTEKHKKNIGLGRKGIEPWNKGLKVGPYPKSRGRAISKALKGNTPWNKGKTGSQVAWNKGLKQPHKTCPHCGTIGAGGNMTRYHFDNCKSKEHIS